MKKYSITVAILILTALPVKLHGALAISYQFHGRGNWSLDAVGSNNSPVGTIQASVPLGSTIEKAYLYTSFRTSASGPIVDFDGVIYADVDFTPLGTSGPLQAYRADVTNQVATKIGGGGAGLFDFTVYSENWTSSTNPSYQYYADGEILAIVYSNPIEAERMIAFVDGFSEPTGETTTIALPSPLGAPAASGLEALMSLGIGFSYQSPSIQDQYTIVDVNNRRLTSSAGGYDDGTSSNGGLITVGGIGDSSDNPDPYAPPTDTRTDDELYDLAVGNCDDSSPFLSEAMSSFTIRSHPDDSDNLFFLGLNVTTSEAVPEPASLAVWVAISGIGLALGWKRRWKVV